MDGKKTVVSRNGYFDHTGMGSGGFKIEAFFAELIASARTNGQIIV